MNPMTSGALNASIPSIRQTQILRFSVERHPSRTNAGSHFGSGVTLRTVVDYLNLHLVPAWILFEYA
jgi:hypothetical protein